MAGAGGGSGNHSDPGIAPFFSMSNSGLSTSLHQMASGDYRQLDISKVQVLRTSPQRELVGLLPLSNGWKAGADPGKNIAHSTTWTQSEGDFTSTVCLALEK